MPYSIYSKAGADAEFSHKGHTLDETVDSVNRLALTPAERDKLAAVASGAEVNVNADWSAASGDAQILNKPTLGTAAATAATAYATAAQGATADSASQPGHGHTLTDTAGLQGALNSKSDTMHTHTLDDLSNVSDTLGVTGDVLTKQVDGTWLPAGAPVATATAPGGIVLTGDLGGTAGNPQVKNKVANTTQIVAGTGLTGGGPLSANVTLAVAYGSAAGTAAQGNDVRLSDARTPLTHTHTIADVTGLQTALDAKATKRTVPATVAAATYMIAAGDEQIGVRTTSATAVTITVPAGLPVGFEAPIYVDGAGMVTVVGASGVTLVPAAAVSRATGVPLAIKVVASDRVFVVGDLA